MLPTRSRKKGHRWQSTRALPLYMLDTKGYKHTLRICNVIAFQLQAWSHESASVLRYTSITCLVYFAFYHYLLRLYSTMPSRDRRRKGGAGGSQRQVSAALHPERRRSWGWASGPLWMGPENLAPTGVRAPDRPGRSQSPYRYPWRLKYPYKVLALATLTFWRLMSTIVVVPHR